MGSGAGVARPLPCGGPARGALAGVTERDLASFGATLEPKLFPGVRDLLTELRGLVERFNVEIEYYIISGGLLPLIEACPTVRDFMTAVYASEFDTDAAGVPRGIRRAVTFTEKTRYLFETTRGASALPPDRRSWAPYTKRN
jgi:hypothetical protein